MDRVHIKGKSKTVGDIRKNMGAKVKNGLTLDEVVESVRAELIAYYSLDKGQEELSRTPHKNLPVDVAVDLLMQDIEPTIRREVGELERRNKLKGNGKGKGGR